MNAKLQFPSTPHRTSRAFSLVELMLSISILAILLVMVTQMLARTQETWRESKIRVAQFRDARLAFENITRNLSQATLNTYLDYYKADNTPWTLTASDERNYGQQYNTADRFEPDYYDRFSELHFVVDRAEDRLDIPTNTHCIFFQAQLGEVRNKDEYGQLGNLLNGRGYFVQYSDDTLTRPAFLKSRYTPTWRFRLMEYRPSSESNRIYSIDPTWQGDNSGEPWFATTKDELDRDARVIANNIVALIIAPVTSIHDSPSKHDIAPNYVYNTRARPGTANPDDRKQFHQLPPLVQVTMVALSEPSAAQYDFTQGTQPDSLFSKSLFKTANRYADDLRQLESDLTSKNLDYRIFSATIPIRGAKWSQDFAQTLPGA